MMKSTLAIFVLAAVMVALAYAQPLQESEHVDRFRRASCDLFSFESKWLTPNDSVCAAHCLVKGYKGGKCKNGICNCRDKF